MSNRLALGTAQFGLNYGINNQRGKTKREEVIRILDFASEHEIDLLDTAYSYGDSETVIGDCLKNINKSFKLVSKLPGCQPAEVKSVVDQSRRRLGSEKLYGYLIHDYSHYNKQPEIFDELHNLKGKGIFEKVGFSLYRPEEVLKLIEKKVDFSIVQVPYNIFDRRFESVFPMLRAHDVEIHVRSVFLQGLFFKQIEELDENFKKIIPKLKCLKSVSERYNVPISAICVCFTLLNENIDKSIIGVDDIKNLRENIDDLRYIDVVEGFYGDLKGLEEQDECVILPINWK